VNAQADALRGISVNLSEPDTGDPVGTGHAGDQYRSLHLRSLAKEVINDNRLWFVTEQVNSVKMWATLYYYVLRDTTIACQVYCHHNRAITFNKAISWPIHYPQ